MIEALSDLGKWALKQDNKNLDDPIGILTDNPATSDRYKHVLLITLDETTDYVYTAVECPQHVGV